jgi:hypothetical protein
MTFHRDLWVALPDRLKSYQHDEDKKTPCLDKVSSTDNMIIGVFSWESCRSRTIIAHVLLFKVLPFQKKQGLP